MPTVSRRIAALETRADREQPTDTFLETVARVLRPDGPHAKRMAEKRRQEKEEGARGRQIAQGGDHENP